MPSLGTSTQVVIIGAGQAGLSTAYHLSRQGLVAGRDLIILDRGPDAGGAWQHRWNALRVGDAHRIHDLPGMSETGLSFATAPMDLPARDVVRDYYAAYEDHYALDVRRPATVTAVHRDGDGDEITDGFSVGVTVPTGAVSYRTRVVVNASGTWARPRVPQVAGADIFAGVQLSTPQYVSASEFAGKRVAVVGAGTSALGFLDELTTAGADTTWFTRRPPKFVSMEEGLDRNLGVAAVQRQDNAAQAGRRLPSIVGSTGLPWNSRARRLEPSGALTRHPMFARLVTDGAVASDGTHIALDAVIWATGFDAELDHLGSLALDATEGGITVKDGESADALGLFLAGYGPQASTIGANRAGRAMARLIMKKLG
jgi:cation diffusion facilitator CzcD-associated flavoprotein CzcO